MTADLVSSQCLVCSSRLAVPFFDGGNQSLATLGWPSDEDEAQRMDKFPLDYIQCPKCGHVWNKSFSYDVIPYHNHPNRMFNKGGIWRGHLAKTRDAILERLPKNPTLIDIGCGEGHFVREISEDYNESGRFIGFDPCGAIESGRGIEFYPRYFLPLTDMERFSPDIVIVRHVIEHLEQPSEFMQQFAWGSISLEKPCWLFAEVPCIDRVFTSKRLADFFYEHPSQFSTDSFRLLMEGAGEIEIFGHGCGGEIVYALIKLSIPSSFQLRAKSASEFCDQAVSSLQVIQLQLSELAASGSKLAIWGGTGKAAAFINQFNADKKRFPLVVDSDPEKVGTYVPSSGQKIMFRDELKSNPVDIIIIPTHWRAQDIQAEMEREKIKAKQIFIEHDGCLIDIKKEEHPYR